MSPSNPATLTALVLTSLTLTFTLTPAGPPGSRAGEEQLAAPEAELDDTQFSILVKAFCVEMRRHHDSGTSREFRRNYFDPRYLEEHGLSAADLQLEMAPVGSIHNIRVADDRETCAAHVSLANGQAEIILFRTSTLDGQLYLWPAGAPDPVSGSISPWILRMAL